jgi:hypothetical protein
MTELLAMIQLLPYFQFPLHSTRYVDQELHTSKSVISKLEQTGPLIANRFEN